MVAEPADRGRRLVIALIGVAAVGLIVMAGAIIAVDRSVDRVGVTGLGEGPGGASDPDDGDADGNTSGGAAEGPTPDPLTVLVLGSDSREMLSEEQRRELGTGDAWGERMETIALVRLDPAAERLRMLSVPRDTLLTRCDGSRGRVNAAYHVGNREGTGAMSCVVQTVSEWGGITIDHAVKVDFLGFVDIVDAVGGVPMTLAAPITDERANLDLPAGCTRLDGAEALAFVRARSIDSDFGRIARQQRFVDELRTEILELGLLSDLPRLYRTAMAMARAVELDDGLTLGRIRELTRQHRESLRSPVQGHSIPGRTEVSDGMAFLRVDERDVREAFRWLERGGEPPADAYDAAIGEPDEPPAGTVRPDPDDTGPGAGNGDPDGDPSRDRPQAPRC